MTPEEFRRHGHELIDRIANYRATLADRPVRSEVAPGAIRAALPKAAPTAPEPFAAIFADLDAFREHTPITDDQSTVVMRVLGGAKE